MFPVFSLKKKYAFSYGIFLSSMSCLYAPFMKLFVIPIGSPVSSIIATTVSIPCAFSCWYKSMVVPPSAYTGLRGFIGFTKNVSSPTLNVFSFGVALVIASSITPVSAGIMSCWYDSII